MRLSEKIRAETRRLGFHAVGISRVDPPPHQDPPPNNPDSHLHRTRAAHLWEWLHRGYQGTMAWMERDPERRSDPRRVLPGCRSVISVGMNYYTDNQADERPGHGRIARYAWGEDYHDLLLDRLKQLEGFIKRMAPEAETRRYVDTGPVMEKFWAQQAGLGWIGKHSNLVSPQFGSWLLLGEVLTTLELAPDEAGTDLCGSCALCIRACPTGAITQPYVVDATKCISYLTIEWRGDEDNIPSDLARNMGNRIFGCDDCLDACPYNAQAHPTAEAAFHPSALTLAPNLTTLADLGEGEFKRTFRRSPIRRSKYAGFLRNLRIATRNLTRSVVSSSSA